MATKACRMGRKEAANHRLYNENEAGWEIRNRCHHGTLQHTGRPGRGPTRSPKTPTQPHTTMRKEKETETAGCERTKKKNERGGRWYILRLRDGAGQLVERDGQRLDEEKAKRRITKQASVRRKRERKRRARRRGDDTDGGPFEEKRGARPGCDG